jgi:creatinine amidohydrolase
VDLLTSSTSRDVRERGAQVAVLPVGSFEQHGTHLPLITDTIVACGIARAVADVYDLFLLPPITLSCSHEHGRFPGTVSVSSRTLQAAIDDVATSLTQSGISKLVVVNGHGGNYVLSNIVQEANVASSRMILFPGNTDWAAARIAAGCETDDHADMHAGEAETSILLSMTPDLVREGWQTADWQAPERPDLLLVGMDGYTASGVIGTPSAASAAKGAALIDALTSLFSGHLKLFTEDTLSTEQ